MSILDPKQDAAALESVTEQALSEATADLVTKIGPALSQAVKDALDGLTITITISKKGGA